MKISGSRDIVLESVVLAEILSKGELFVLRHAHSCLILTNFKLRFDSMRGLHTVDNVHGRMRVGKLNGHAGINVALRKVVDLLIGLIRQMHT